MFIFEVRRMDLGQNADKSALYRWLRVDKDTLKVTPLTFVSMNSSGIFDERFFKQGYLSFDSQKAVFIAESSSVQHILDINWPDDLPDFLEVAVHSFLTKLRKEAQIEPPSEE
ncbi:hypothetical protein [Dyadobacter sp. 3J3]|uniref:hypothetical protein n=1 Tax=Dyadobacter sp. 3J3 TaxID=2606600 RepID=UPI001359E1AF|nr:hypothetical protein [Dyadobacter sp. 3J3]